MTSRRVPFQQVDVFTSVPFMGNPLAVVFDADGLGTEQMQRIAHWTNLSETAFLCEPTDPAADYRVRIFTTHYELPFAGHPTLGSAHAWLARGGRPRTPGRLVQQCGVGLVELAEQDRGWAFAAPRAHYTAVPEHDYATLAAALGGGAAIDFAAAPHVVDNGCPWLIVRVESLDACLALQPDYTLLAPLVKALGAVGLAAYAPHGAGGVADFELRCLLPTLGAGVEDPVTGSANAALAGLLKQQNLRPGASYTVRQGTMLGRNGHVHVSYDDDAQRIWIGGASVTVIDRKSVV